MTLPVIFRSKAYFCLGEPYGISFVAGMKYGKLVVTEEKIMFKGLLSNHIFEILVSEVQRFFINKRKMARLVQVITIKGELYSILVINNSIYNKRRLDEFLDVLHNLMDQEKNKKKTKEEKESKQIEKQRIAQQTGKKACIFCDSTIDLDALICPFCGRDQ